ncbi:non-homologous end-joining DNA ligase [candidate division KSB1 bacterium]|nr:non-homologous end-joining DNA ligase [candidate division KSB1 bacterium]
MPRTAQLAQVGKRKIELSNLEKVLYPDDQIIKAEIIQYYLKAGPTILSHVKGRALSLIRYPNGIDGEQFFQKNRPDWSPDWIEYVTLGKEKKNYILATEEASLVWLANLACLEMHQMHSRSPHFDNPDYIVFDLDPPDGYPFTGVVEIGLNLKEHIENFGYHPFVKTTGRKGLHIVIPIETKWTFNQAFEAASAVAKPFVDKYKQTTTLHIKKDARKGKVLVDIYRNRGSQTIVSPYSLRGLPMAPVSMPLRWEDLADVTDLKVFNIHTVPDLIISEGDAWDGIRAYATNLHTQRKPIKQVKQLKPSRSYKTPETLKGYEKKREFEKTSEPKAEEIGGDGNAFVVHRHHASRLHYDLRLEHEGTLRSWAVPRGLPPRPGIKRMAISVEDHPLKYLNFEGEIPKGQYGGGMMWIFAQGKYEITKQKKDGFYFRLNSKAVNGEYRIYQTRGNEWLFERVDNPQIDWLHDQIDFMLSSSQSKPPQSDDYIYEVKWDGIRAMISIDEGEIRIRSRNQRDITNQFPELLALEQSFRVNAGLFDGEIVCLDEAGKPDFKKTVNRLHHNSAGAIERARAKNPVVCYVFDCLYLDGRSLVNEPLMLRREWLVDSIKRDSPYRVSEAMDEGVELFKATQAMGLEGIMAKERESKYLPGKRSTTWIKIKVRQTIDCVILGYTKGKGDREPYFGALHIGTKNGAGFDYLGKVGSGFDTRLLKSIYSELKRLKVTKRQIKEKPLGDAESIWLEPTLVCEIQYASKTSNGTLREPVFVRLRPDLMK